MKSGRVDILIDWLMRVAEDPDFDMSPHGELAIEIEDEVRLVFNDYENEISTIREHLSSCRALSEQRRLKIVELEKHNG